MRVEYNEYCAGPERRADETRPKDGPRAARRCYDHDFQTLSRSACVRTLHCNRASQASQTNKVITKESWLTHSMYMQGPTSSKSIKLEILGSPYPTLILPPSFPPDNERPQNHRSSFPSTTQLSIETVAERNDSLKLACVTAQTHHSLGRSKDEHEYLISMPSDTASYRKGQKTASRACLP
jgi:hypothetical protein